MKERKIRSRAHILSGSYDKEFAANVATELGLSVEEATITHFANTELKAEVPTVRGDHVFVIGSHSAPVNEAIMEQIALIKCRQQRKRPRHNRRGTLPWVWAGRPPR